MNLHPDCGGPDNTCIVADARGPHCRCTTECAYYEPPSKSALNPQAAWPFPKRRDAASSRQPEEK